MARANRTKSTDDPIKDAPVSHAAALFQSMLAGDDAWWDGRLRQEDIGPLLDEALKSLSRSNSILEAETKALRAFNEKFAIENAKLAASQRETRAMIEELVNGR